MKNIIALLFCAVASLMTSCTLSKEEKAEKLVKETLKGYLFHPESYEPLSTKVDSMFVDATTIAPIMEICDDINNLMSKINECRANVEIVEHIMDIPYYGNSSRFFRREYARSKKKRDEAQTDIDKYTKKLSEKLASLKEYVAKYYKGEFTGWAVSHRFRSLNGAGTVTIPEEMIFLCDKGLTTCIDCYEVNRLERLAKILEVLYKATSDEDIIDYFKDDNSLLHSYF